MVDGGFGFLLFTTCLGSGAIFVRAELPRKLTLGKGFDWIFLDGKVVFR